LPVRGGVLLSAQMVRFPRERVRANGIITGLTGGFFSGLTGVGGGVIMVPLLRRLQGLAQHKAHGTSLAIVIFVGPAGLIGYWLNGNIDWKLAPWLAVGSAFGAYFGAVTMSRLAPRSLQLVFGVFLLLVAIRMFLA
jgi:uncharacterized membrane protein YfcA